MDMRTYFLRKQRIYQVKKPKQNPGFVSLYCTLLAYAAITTFIVPNDRPTHDDSLFIIWLNILWFGGSRRGIRECTTPP